MGNEPSPANDYLADHANLLIVSYRRWTGLDLVSPTVECPAKALYEAPFVVVSHATEADPIFNYGNRRAQELFEMSWHELTRLPSRCSAEPLEQAERERLMQTVRQHGFIDDYRGVRISARGRRFLIEQALVWNVVDPGDRLQGQAAMFDRWTPLPKKSEG